MKSNYLIKSLPFLSTILLIVLLNISNQKVKTKLRILIWDTPSSSLGTYLAISAGSGFLFSYIVTTNLASINSLKSYRSIKSKPENYTEENNEYAFSNLSSSYEKTLIERNVNDPSPTMNAQFRVIGKTQKYNSTYINNDNQYDIPNDYEESFVDQNENIDNTNKEKQLSTDWNDDSFNSW